MDQTTVEESQQWFKAQGWHFDKDKDFVDKDGKGHRGLSFNASLHRERQTLGQEFSRLELVFLGD